MLLKIYPAILHCSEWKTKPKRENLLPGYGTLPYVTISVKRTPKDHTSDLMVKVPKLMASGAVHLIGNFAPDR